MAKLRISHHTRVAGHPHRWHVHLEAREAPLVVELHPEDRRQLELSDEEIDALLPTAVQRRVDEMSPDEEPDALPQGVTWDAPVRIYQTHFLA